MFFQEQPGFGCVYETCSFQTNDGDASFGHYYGHMLDHHEEEVLGTLNVVYARNILQKKLTLKRHMKTNLNL